MIFIAIFISVNIVRNKGAYMQLRMNYSSAWSVILLLSIALYVDNILDFIAYYHIITTVPPEYRVPPVTEIPIPYKILFVLSLIGLALLLVYIMKGTLGRTITVYITAYTVICLLKLINDLSGGMVPRGMASVGNYLIFSLIYLTVLILSIFILIKARDIKDIKKSTHPFAYIATAIFCYLVSMAIRFPLTAGSYDSIIFGLVTSSILTTAVYCKSSGKRDTKMIVILILLAITAVIFLAYPVYLACFGPRVGIELGLDLLFILFSTYPLTILAIFRMYQLKKSRMILWSGIALILASVLLILAFFIKMLWSYCQFPIMPMVLVITAYMIICDSLVQ